MITKRFVHFEKYETFLTKKVSDTPSDASYKIGGVGSTFVGSPDISWESIVFIKDLKYLYTHGQLYDASGVGTLKNSVKINGTDFDGTSGVVTESWGSPRSIKISDSPGTHFGVASEVDGGSDITLILPDTIDAKVSRDSSGKIIRETYSTKEETSEIDERVVNLESNQISSLSFTENLLSINLSGGTSISIPINAGNIQIEDKSGKLGQVSIEDSLVELINMISSSSSSILSETRLSTQELQSQINNLSSGVYKFKGTVSGTDDLPGSGNQVGDVWFVSSVPGNYVYSGGGWDFIGNLLNISDYFSVITQEDYDSLENKDPSKFYFIPEE